MFTAKSPSTPSFKRVLFLLLNFLILANLVVDKQTGSFYLFSFTKRRLHGFFSMVYPCFPSAAKFSLFFTLQSELIRFTIRNQAINGTPREPACKDCVSNLTLHNFKSGQRLSDALQAGSLALRQKTFLLHSFQW